MDNLEIDLLRELIGSEELGLYSSRMIIIWGESITVPDFSVKYGKKWIIIESIVESFEDSYIEWNRMKIQSAHLADLPKDADHVIIEGRQRVVKHALSSIDFPGPYVIKSIEAYKFTISNPESNSRIIEYDGCLVFNFEDGRRFAISSYQAPGGVLGFTTGKEEINTLTSLSTQRKLIT
jgi:hypothetical protein